MTIKRSLQFVFASALLLAAGAAAIVVMASANNQALVRHQRLRLEAASATRAPFDAAANAAEDAPFVQHTAAYWRMIEVVAVLFVGLVVVAYPLITKMAAELSNAERRLRDAHADLMAIIDTVPAAILILNADRSWRIENKAAVELLGIPPSSRPERLKYLATFTFRAKDGRVLSIDELPPVRALSGVEIAGEEIDVERADGYKEVILISAKPLRDATGQISGTIAVFQDMSKLRDVAKMKDEFVAIVSHELRTPLTAIRGSLQLLVADDALPDPDHRDLVAAGLASADRLMRLVNDILDVSKIEAGKLDLSIAPVEVAGLFERSVAGVESVARNAGVSIVCNVPPDIPAIHGDSDRLTQALINLLSNAIKFAPRGSEVTMSAAVIPTGVALSVADRGVGIGPGDLEKLFGKFQQLAHSRTMGKGGTGLGLAITKAIVEQHGGRVSVESALGQGTTFTATLPLTGPVASV